MVFIFYLEQLDLQSLIFEVSSTSWRAKDEKKTGDVTENCVKEKADQVY